MKVTLTAIFAILAASVAAVPITSKANTMTMTLRRTDFNKAALSKRSAEGYDGPIADSVNYILVLLADDEELPDPYQDEIDAIENPADVLG